MALKSKHFLLLFTVFFADRISKFFVSNYLSGQVELLPFLKLSLVHNKGVAFGLLNSFELRWFFVVLSLAVVVFLFYQSKKEKSNVVLCSFVLIIAGALGNALDRILFGSVIDFIDFIIWPAFNIADSAVTIGVLMLLYKTVDIKKWKQPR